MAWPSTGVVFGSFVSTDRIALVYPFRLPTISETPNKTITLAEIAISPLKSNPLTNVINANEKATEMKDNEL